MTTLLVALGAAIGAPARYALDVTVTRWTHGQFPHGTLVVNVLAALALGLVTGLALHHGLGNSERAFMGTGLIATFSTYSTFSQETVSLFLDGRRRAAFA